MFYTWSGLQYGDSKMVWARGRRRDSDMVRLLLFLFTSAEVGHHIFPRRFYIVDRPTLAVGLHRI